MCGIAGIVRYDRPAVLSRPAVGLMLRRLRHRGPDSSGVAVSAFAALGNVRLSLLDATNGSQPMTSPGGRWHLTYNGEVYNWRELKEELRDRWDFRSQCDTELVLAALVSWGEAALDRFNGMFALFLWDAETHTGFGARDALGVKPFVYSHADGVFSFTSEAKALVAQPGRTPRADPTAVLEYLVAPYFSGVERPMFEGLHHLPPGHLLRISRRGLELKTWWDWRQPGSWRLDHDPLAATLAERLRQSVDRVLGTDHAMGGFLSGGLDSTLLISLAARRTAGMRTFGIQFQDQAAFDYDRSLIVRSDDTPFAEAAARQIGVRHTTVTVARERLPEDLRRISAINDTLPAWEQELAQHHLARAAHEAGLRCVLVGDAADETHYGYPFLLDQEATHSPGAILRRFGLPPLAPAFAHAVADLERHYHRIAEEAGHHWRTPESRMLATTCLIVKRWLPRLLQNGDVHTMAFSVEARVPFSDTAVLDLARVVHPSLGFRMGTEKSLLREAARGLMPERYRIRPKSSLPKDQRTGAVYRQEAARALRESGSFLRTWLDLPALDRLCQPGHDLTESERALLFRVICLHHWHQHYEVGGP